MQILKARKPLKENVVIEAGLNEKNQLGLLICDLIEN